MNKLVILEDDLNFSRHLFNHISKNVKNVKLVNIFVNEDELISSLSHFTYEDIFLIDLDTKKLNSIGLLDYFKNISINLPSIIVISEDMDLLQKATKYTYLYKIVKKPFYFNTISNAIGEVVEKNLLFNIKTIVKEELKHFKFNTSSIGYAYLVDSIELALHNEDLLKDTKNYLFEEVSKRYPGTTSAKIKWSVEKCVDTLYRTTNINVINNYFFIDNEFKLTPKLFLSTVVNNLSKKIS